MSQCDQWYCCLNVVDGPRGNIVEGGYWGLHVIKGLVVLTSLLDLVAISMNVGLCVSM